MESFTNLEAWKVGMELIKEVYRLSKKFPREEMFGLTFQIRKSCTSILANLAEGFSKYTFPDKAAKYVISRGECSETKAFLLIVVALEFVKNEDVQKALTLAESVGRLLSGLIRSNRGRSQ